MLRTKRKRQLIPALPTHPPLKRATFDPYPAPFDELAFQMRSLRVSAGDTTGVPAPTTHRSLGSRRKPIPAATTKSIEMAESPITPPATDQSPETSQQSVTSASSPPGDADRFEELVELEHQENLMRAWRRSRRVKTVPCPSMPADYLSEPMELVWSETDTTKQRRLYNQRKYQKKDRGAQPVRKNLRAGDQQTPPPLKTNRTYELRTAYVRRQPIISTYFETHFNRHRKPPFRFNVKFVR